MSEEAAEPETFNVSVRFECDFETDVLSAHIAEGSAKAIDTAYLAELLEEQGFRDYLIESEAMQNLVSHITTGNVEPLPVGERRHATLKISVADDAMAAYATSEPPAGGDHIGNSMIEAALEAAGVKRSRCIEAALQELMTQDSMSHLLIAEGEAVEHGTDSQFLPQVEGIVVHAPTKLARGNVDQYDFMKFTVVEEGTLLMRREPATTGKDGVDVRGKRIPATPGKTVGWASGLTGAVLDESDDNLLIAETKGHPILMSNGVRLDEVLKLPSADRRTGHVEFDGTIYINGDVSAGVELDASGDVFIKGTLEDATIRAGADIIIGGGIINAEPPEDEDNWSINLQAGRDIHAKFVTGALLKAEGSVIIKEYIGFCETEAQHQVLVGQSGGKGRIYGGSCHGHNGIHANQLGSNSSAATLISAGLTSAPTEDQSELNEALASLEDQCKKVQFLMENLSCDVSPGTTGKDQETATPDPETCNKLMNTLTMLEQQQEEMRQALAELQNDSEVNPAIRVDKVVRAGVTMRINGVQRNFKAQDTGGAFQLSKGAVVRVE